MSDVEEGDGVFHNAVIGTLLPERSKATIEEVLESDVLDNVLANTALLPIKQRELLFFGKPQPLSTLAA